MQSLYDHMVLENIFDETGSTRNNEGIQAAAVTSGQNSGDSIEDVFFITLQITRKCVYYKSNLICKYIFCQGVPCSKDC